MPWGALSSQQRIAILLQLVGGPQYRAQVAGAAAATRQLGAATRASGMAMKTASQRTWLQNQALFTMRRYAFYGTLAITALAGAFLKLGYGYLSAKQQAEVALKPIMSAATFAAEFNRLFTLAKYSPFVIGDLTTAFRVMYPAMHLAGIGVAEVHATIKAMVDAMSLAGKSTPGMLGRVSYAIQHMLNQGRLTGRLVQQLSMLGIPVGSILRSMGIAESNMANIARLNISPQSFLTAFIRFVNTTKGFRGAALRISLGTVHGQIQALKDSMSQISAIFIQPAFGKTGGFLYNLVKPGGPLDRLGKIKSPHKALMELSRMITGHTGLGQGIELLVSLLKNLGLVFINVVVPAFVMGLHSLILFWPALWILNGVLGFVAHNAWIVKYALVPLAAWFVITHSAVTGMWIASKILNIVLFGTAGVIKRALLWLIAYRAGTASTTKWTRLWTAATKGQVFWTKVQIANNRINTAQQTLTQRAIIATRAAIIGASLATKTWVIDLIMLRTAIFGIPVLGWILLLITVIATLVILFIKWKWFHGVVITILTAIGQAIYFILVRPLLFVLGLFAKVGKFIWGHGGSFIVHGLLGFAEGGVMPYNGPAVVGERGPEIVNLPRGSSITPLREKAVNQVDFSHLGADDGRPIVVQLHVNRRVLAEEVARARQDKQARR